MKSKRKEVSYVYLLVVFLIVSALASVVAYVNAYFTSTASKDGDLTFHNIKLEVNTTNENNSVFSATLGTVVPGDTLEFNEVSVKNTGTADVYSLINLNISITKADNSEYVINEWYNLAGEEVSVNNMTTNTTEATLVATSGSEYVSLSYKFDGNTFDNSFKNSQINATLKAVGIQSANLEPIGTITSDPLIAAYMLIESFNTPSSNLTINYAILKEQGSLSFASPTGVMEMEGTKLGVYNFAITNITSSDTA